MQILPYDGTMRTTPKKAHEGQARAKFNFIAQTNLELSLVKGELKLELFDAASILFYKIKSYPKS